MLLLIFNKIFLVKNVVVGCVSCVGCVGCVGCGLCIIISIIVVLSFVDFSITLFIYKKSVEMEQIDFSKPRAQIYLQENTIATSNLKCKSRLF